jgi:nucleotide-binding universal stress UspA family protein
MMYRKIMVPLDGSAFGEQALPLALALARRCDATVYLAHVRDEDWSKLPAAPGASADQPWTQDQIYLERVAESAVSGNLPPVDTALLDGPVAEALSAYAQTNSIDLIVMSTHGRGALGRIWLGSVAAAMACRTPAPLLLMRPPQKATAEEQETTVHHILIPLDGSRLAEAALEPALMLGKLTGARYTLLQALDPLLVEHTRPPYAAGLERYRLPEIWNTAERYLESIAAQLRESAVQVQTSVVIGQPPQAIYTYVEAQQVDLIAMATHGHSGLIRYILGSVADAVVHRADVPVLLVRPSREQHEKAPQGLAE